MKTLLKHYRIQLHRVGHCFEPPGFVYSQFDIDIYSTRFVTHIKLPCLFLVYHTDMLLGFKKLRIIIHLKVTRC